MLPITLRNDGSLINDRIERIELLFLKTYLIPNQRSVWTGHLTTTGLGLISNCFNVIKSLCWALYPVKGLQIVLGTLCEYLVY